uniref:O-methyltransferase domain-containing protein n=1 Tax=Oryza meridionalis TaxID=40149 RepID=A0A0E0DGA4_9ORYZ
MDNARESEDEHCLYAQELVFAYNRSMVLRAAIQLGLLDALAAGGDALTADELAGKIQATDGVAVGRILRFLASFDVVRCSTETSPGGGAALIRRYTPAPVCRWLTKNNGEGSLAPFSVFIIDEDHLLPWQRIAEAVASGGPAPSERTNGMPYHEYIGNNKRLSGLFDHAMAQHSAIRARKMLERFEGFDGIQRLVDVGGGDGSTLGMITSRYKHIRGINYDLPHVISQAPSLPGVEHIAGDMYESVPNGDAILLQWMLLMFSDEDCIKILKNCHQALPEGGKVIIVEGLLPETPNTTPAARDSFTMDMILFVLFKVGKHRTEEEFAKLAKESGFTGTFRSTYIFLNFYALEFNK